MRMETLVRVCWGFLPAMSAALALLAPTPAHAAAPPLAITSPANGTVVAAGQAVSITVTIGSGKYPKGIGVLGAGSLGDTDLKSATGSTVTFSLSIPADATPRTYAITAIGADSMNTLVLSNPVNLIVERSDLPTALTVSPPLIPRLNVGETVPLTVLGTFTAGVLKNVTGSTHLVATSENPSIASVQLQQGMVTVVTAVGTGQTNIVLQYGSVSVKIPVMVPAPLAGDLNGDGFVNCSDLSVIWSCFGKSVGQPGFDARADLNKDGFVNGEDLEIEAGLMPCGTVCNGVTYGLANCPVSQ